MEAPLLVDLAMAVACLDLLDPLVLQENPEGPENPVHLVCPEIQENHQFNHANPLLPHHANHALKVLPAHPDLLDHLVMPEPLDNLEILALMLHPANPDQKDHLDLLESPDNLVPLVSLEPPLNLNLSFQVNLDLLVKPAHLDLQDPPVNLVLMALPGQLDQKDHLDLMDPLAKTDNPALPVNPAPLDPLERRVSARNTVPSMVVCSSKTEPDVRHLYLLVFFFSCLQFIQVSSTVALSGAVVSFSSS